MKQFNVAQRFIKCGNYNINIRHLNTESWFILCTSNRVIGVGLLGEESPSFWWLHPLDVYLEPDTVLPERIEERSDTKYSSFP